MPITRSQSKAQDKDTSGQDYKNDRERGRTMVKGKAKTTSSKSKPVAPSGTPIRLGTHVKTVFQKQQSGLVAAVSSPSLSSVKSSGSKLTSAASGGSCANLPTGGTVPKLAKAGSTSRLVGTPAKHVPGVGFSSSMATGRTVSKLVTKEPPKLVAKEPLSQVSKTTTNKDPLFKVAAGSSTQASRDPSPKLAKERSKLKTAAAGPTVKIQIDKPLPSKSKPETKAKTDESDSSKKATASAKSQEPGAAANGVPVEATTTKKRKGKGGRPGRKHQDRLLLKAFLVKYPEASSGVELRSKIKEVEEKNTKELEALLQQVMNKNDDRDDVLKNSPMMVKAVKSGRKVKKVNTNRLMTPGFNPTPIPLRIATLKTRGVDGENGERVTRSKIQLNVGSKRMRSPDTDTDSPVRLKQNISKFNFMNAMTKQPKKKLKERGGSANSEKKSAKKEDSNNAKLPPMPVLVPAPATKVAPNTAEQNTDVQNTAAQSTAIQTTTAQIGTAQNTAPPALRKYTFTTYNSLDTTYNVPAKTEVPAVPKHEEIPTNLPPLAKKPEPVPAVQKKPELVQAPQKKPEAAPLQQKPEPVPVLQKKPEPMPVIQKKPEPMIVIQKKPEPMIVIQKKLEPMPVIQKKPEPLPIIQNKPEPMPVFQKKAEPTLVVQKKPETLPVVKILTEPMFVTTGTRVEVQAPIRAAPGPNPSSALANPTAEPDKQARLLSSLEQELSVMALDDDDERDEVAPMPFGGNGSSRSTETFLMPPPTPKSAGHKQVENKENKETYDITLLADYDEEALEHRADKVVPEWAMDQNQIDYLLFRFSSPFVDEITELRMFPRGTQYSRFYPNGAQKYRPVPAQNTIKQ